MSDSSSSARDSEMAEVVDESRNNDSNRSEEVSGMDGDFITMKKQFEKNLELQGNSGEKVDFG